MLASTTSDTNRYRLRFTVLLLREWVEYQRLEIRSYFCGGTSFRVGWKTNTPVENGLKVWRLWKANDDPLRAASRNRWTSSCFQGNVDLLYKTQPETNGFIEQIPLH
jgi:hypothetical protein